MHILQVSADIFHKILYHCILARGLRRGLRLKLVCKAFYHALEPALFESRVLDHYGPGDRLAGWYSGQHQPNGAKTLFHSYLRYRVKNETNPDVGRFVEIHDIAKRLHTETGADLEETIDLLSWLALEGASSAPANRTRWTDNGRAQPNHGLNLLSAAAYLNHIDLAKQLLQDGHDPAAHNFLFQPPMELAAWAGNTDMLLLFQEHMPEYEKLSGPYEWRGKVGPCAIKGAAIRGDIDMVRLAMHPPSSTNRDFWKDIDMKTQPGSNLFNALRQTTNLEVFQYISDFFHPTGKEDRATSLLLCHVRYGNLEMARRALDDGADIRGYQDGEAQPLMLAARRCHEDIVDLLLERGADPNYFIPYHRGMPLTAAVCGGSLVIFRKLLDHGAKVVHRTWDGYWSAKACIIWTLNLEHTGILELLLERSADSEPGLVQPVMKHAKKSGLESMVDLLRQRYGSQADIVE
jgi:ankyrin repeat protein